MDYMISAAKRQFEIAVDLGDVTILEELLKRFKYSRKWINQNANLFIAAKRSEDMAIILIQNGGDVNRVYSSVSLNKEQTIATETRLPLLAYALVHEQNELVAELLSHKEILLDHVVDVMVVDSLNNTIANERMPLLAFVAKNNYKIAAELKQQENVNLTNCITSTYIDSTEGREEKYLPLIAHIADYNIDLARSLFSSPINNLKNYVPNILFIKRDFNNGEIKNEITLKEYIEEKILVT